MANARKPKPGKKSSSGRSNRGPKYSKRQREVESVDMESNSKLDADQRGSSDYHRGAPNDWRWYAASPQLVADYASYPFGTPVGTDLWTGDAAIDAHSVPGVMALEFSPTIGNASKETDPINVAMRKLYSFVRYQNSGAKNYDAPDMMLYMIAVDSAYMFLAWMKRLYGVMRDYTPFNRYYPQALVAAMRANFSDVQNNLVQLRGYINQYAFKLTQLFIPNSMSFMARHTWLCEGIYTDSTSRKAQTYLFTPATCFKFALDANGVGSCQYVAFPSNATVADIIEFGESLLAPMIGNEDFGIMSGDILKAFGEGGIVKPAPITEDYQILPVYSQEVLSQIENATIFNGLAVTSNGITQNTAVGGGYLTTNPSLFLNLDVSWVNSTVRSKFNLVPEMTKALVEMLSAKKILNFHHDEVTPAEVMVATRLQNCLTPQAAYAAPTVASGDLMFRINCDTYGSEILNSGVIYRFEGGALKSYDFGTLLPILVNNDTTDFNYNLKPGMDHLAKRLGMLSTFDWHPQVQPVLMHIKAGSGSSGTVYNVTFVDTGEILLDFDNFTIIDRQNLKQMMLAATLSEFTVPMIS